MRTTSILQTTPKNSQSRQMTNSSFTPRGRIRLYRESDRALFCSFGGLSFGDIAEVPAPFLKNPRGIRDIEEWYVSTSIRQEFIQAVFETQTEIAIQNLVRLHAAVGDKISIIQTNGTDFGTQKGPFLSVENYRKVFMPYQKETQWLDP